MVQQVEDIDNIMIEQDIFNNVKTLLKNMVDLDERMVAADDRVHNLDWITFESMDELLEPVGLGSNTKQTKAATPALLLAFGERGDQYIGTGLGGGDIGFDDIPSIGTAREMTPLILRVVLIDDENGDENGDDDVISEQITKAREDIREVIGDKLRTDDTYKIDNVYRVYVGPYDLSADSFYTNTAEFIIPIIVWWRHDYREPDRDATATILEDENSPVFPLLEITHDFEQHDDPNIDGSVSIRYKLPTDTATLSIFEDGLEDAEVTGLRHTGSDEGTWIDTEWNINRIYRFEVVDDGHTSTTPVIRYPYYPAMLPESLYHEGDSPEQNIERKIRQMIQREIDDGDMFDAIETTAAGPLSPNYIKPDRLPVLCISFDQSTLAIGSKVSGQPISNKNIGWRTANARDQVLQMMAMVHAPADRNHTDPYKQIRIIDKTLSELRSFVIKNEQWEGVSSTYQSIIGPSISPRAAENVQGDLLFVGRFNFIVRYRER